MEFMLKQAHCHNKELLTFTPNETLSCYIVKTHYVNIGSLIVLGKQLIKYNAIWQSGN